MALSWIDPDEYSFNSFLLMERFQLRLMLEQGGWRANKPAWRRSMGAALNANPAVRWYFERRCPECADIVQKLSADAPALTDAAEIRAAEVYVLAAVEDFVIHTTPGEMENRCQYIRDWDRERLYEMADFRGKTVLDVGAGSGRLTFAAAALAKEVCAGEPVGTLREFIRGRCAAQNITNVRVTEALVTAIPYPDSLFDIVMSGHVVGDDWDAEISELTRVCKSGGWLLDCPGDETPAGDRGEQQSELERRGWEMMAYTGNGGGTVYRYRKQVEK